MNGLFWSDLRPGCSSPRNIDASPPTQRHVIIDSMIKRTPLDTETVKITFIVPDDGRQVAVIGDFNDWQTDLHPLRRRSNGMRSVALTVPAGTVLRFRYVVADADSYLYVDDPDADGLEPNGFGQTHAVLVA